MSDYKDAVIQLKRKVEVKMQEVLEGKKQLHIAAAELGMMPFEFKAIYMNDK